MALDEDSLDRAIDISGNIGRGEPRTTAASRPCSRFFITAYQSIGVRYAHARQTHTVSQVYQSSSRAFVHVVCLNSSHSACQITIRHSHSALRRPGALGIASTPVRVEAVSQFRLLISAPYVLLATQIRSAGFSALEMSTIPASALMYAPRLRIRLWSCWRPTHELESESRTRCVSPCLDCPLGHLTPRAGPGHGKPTALVIPAHSLHLKVYLRNQVAREFHQI